MAKVQGVNLHHVGHALVISDIVNVVKTAKHARKQQPLSWVGKEAVNLEAPLIVLVAV